MGILRLVRQFFQERAVDQGTSAVGEIRRISTVGDALESQDAAMSKAVER